MDDMRHGASYEKNSIAKLLLELKKVRPMMYSQKTAIFNLPTGMYVMYLNSHVATFFSFEEAAINIP